MMEGLIGCPRTPTTQPRPLDADTAPSNRMACSKVAPATAAHFETLMTGLKLAMPKAPHGGCIVPGAHPHVGKGWSVVPCILGALPDQ